jgi:GNAT superfamily N-acetyltransferase
VNPIEDKAGSYEIEEVRDIDAAWADLCGLFLGLYHHHEPYSPRLVADWERRWRTQLSGGTERLILLGRVDGEAVALMNSRINRTSGVYDEAFGFIEDAYVEPEQRGSGLAQALLQRTEAWCASRGIDLLRLSVHAQNEIGRHFWDKSGFEPMLQIVTKTLTGVAS